MGEASFLPEDYIAQRQERRSSAISLTLFLVVMLAVVGAFFATNRQWKMVKVEQNQINQEYTEARKRIELVRELDYQKTQLVQKAEITAALVERVPRSILLAELVNRMPDSLSLEELELKSLKIRTAAPKAKAKTASLSSSKAPTKAEEEKERRVEVAKFRVTIALEGVAPSDELVAEYLSELGDCPLLSEVELKFSKETTVGEQMLRKFRLEAVLDPNADAKEFEPLKLRRSLRDPMRRVQEFDEEGFDPSQLQVELDGEEN